MKYITLEQLIALVDGDREFVMVLVEQQLIVAGPEGYEQKHVDRVLASRTLVQELEVNWAGVEVILRLREELANARKRLAALEKDSPE